MIGYRLITTKWYITFSQIYVYKWGDTKDRAMFSKEWYDVKQSLNGHSVPVLRRFVFHMNSPNLLVWLSNWRGCYLWKLIWPPRRPHCLVISTYTDVSEELCRRNQQKNRTSQDDCAALSSDSLIIHTYHTKYTSQRKHKFRAAHP